MIHPTYILIWVLSLVGSCFSGYYYAQYEQVRRKSKKTLADFLYEEIRLNAEKYEPIGDGWWCSNDVKVKTLGPDSVYMIMRGETMALTDLEARSVRTLIMCAQNFYVQRES